MFRLVDVLVRQVMAGRCCKLHATVLPLTNADHTSLAN
jgi:hypothetical protein